MNKTESLEKISRGIRHCQRCERQKTRHHAVPGEGHFNTSTLLFGEAPGKNEDKTGRPFVGRAGRYLDKVLAEHEINREDIYITSILKCYHFKSPKKSQMVRCRPWTEQQIEVIQPKIILVMGKSAAWGLFEIDRLGMKPVDMAWHDIPCIVTCHPAAAMRFPERDQQFKRDFSRLILF